MPSLIAHKLSFAHADAVPLLVDVDLHLATGFTGLVGPNGAGKTTLLRLFAGELTPDAGHVRVEPRGATIGICAQTVHHLTGAVRAFARDDGRLAIRLRAELDLAPCDLDRFTSLSPGERRRWQIGAALSLSPEVLLLDEPTNHLDAAARRLLVASLARFDGIGVMVSHDRELLAALTSATVKVERGGAELFSGSYDTAKAEWEARDRARRGVHEKLRNEARTRKAQLAEARSERARAENQRSASARMKNIHDSDARGILADGRAAAAEKRLARTVTTARRRFEEAEGAVSDITIEHEVGRSLFVTYARAPSTRLVAFEADSLRAGEREILRNVRLVLERESRIHVRGDNGAGKTTLIRALIASARLPEDKVLYVPQDVGEDAERAALSEVRALPPASRGRVLSLVAALGVDPARLLASDRPSPGEARKLMIALGLGKHVWALVLDEPTNHLDLPSVERLEAALGAYPGALVLVTHDAAFAQRTTSLVWDVAGGEVIVH